MLSRVDCSLHPPFGQVTFLEILRVHFGAEVHRLVKEDGEVIPIQHLKNPKYTLAQVPSSHVAKHLSP